MVELGQGKGAVTFVTLEHVHSPSPSAPVGRCPDLWGSNRSLGCRQVASSRLVAKE